MELRIGYTRALPVADADVAVLLPDAGSLCGTPPAAYTGIPTVSPPYFADGYLVMTYRDAEQTVTQRACFFPDHGFEATLRGDDVTVFETRIGRAALAVAYDIFQPQYARLCAQRGCALVFAALPPAAQDFVTAGPWSVAQANNLIVSVAAAGGGQLIVPCALTKDLSGFSPDSTVDVGKLAESYAGFPVFDSYNRAFCARYREALLR